MKYLAIDTETTGLDLDGDQLIEIGMVIDDLQDQKPLAGLPRFHCYVQRPKYTGDPFALAMHAKILRRIADREPGYNYLTEGQVKVDLEAWLATHFKRDYRINVAGKNYGSFDRHFLGRLPSVRQEGGKLKIGSWVLAARSLDPGSFLWYPEDTELPNLKKCMERAGIEGEVAHTAIEDAIDVIKLVRYQYSTMSVAKLVMCDGKVQCVVLGTLEKAYDKLHELEEKFLKLGGAKDAFWTVDVTGISR